MLKKHIHDGIVYQEFSDGLRVLGFVDKNDTRDKIYIPDNLLLAEMDGTLKKHYVKEIVKKAFSDSANLQTVCIPDSVWLIGHYAFSGCLKLRKVYTDTAFVHLHSKKTLCMQRGAFQNCPNLQVVEVDKTIGWLANDSFKGCSQLTTVKASVRDISKGAFQGCKLETLTLAKNAKIHEGAIEESGIKELHVADEISYMPQKVWKWCKKANVAICCPPHSKLVDLSYEGFNIVVN